MNPFNLKTLATGVLLIGLIPTLTQAQSGLYGPTPYLSYADSPLRTIAFQWFYLENFEDGQFNVPGVTAQNNAPGGSALGVVLPSRGFVDSVDADDGSIDGSGLAGHSFAPILNDGGESFGTTFTFNSNVLSGLPTHVGIVWTDGSMTQSTTFEAFGSIGESLGLIGPVKLGDGSFNGTTAEDRFFGAFNATGISRITLRTPGGINTLEVDHLQYGSVVPEPATIALFTVGIIGVAFLSALKKRNVL